MSFKTRLFALVLLVSVTGCGLNTGESPPKRVPPSYSGQGFSCVGKIPEHFDKYVNDQLSDQEITTFISCLQKAFVTFAQLTRGRNVNSYSPEEIRSFLHEFFLGERRINDQLMNELMVLKQTMVGGAKDTISRQELYVAVELLEELKNQAIALKPHLKILNPQLAKSQDPRDMGRKLAAANEALNSVIQVLGNRLQRNQHDYPLANAEKLLREFRLFVGWESHFPKSIPPDRWINFLRIFRQLTVVPTDSTIVRPIDWVPMLQSFARWYVLFLQYEIGIKDQPVGEGVGLQNSILLAQEVFGLLEQSASRQKGWTITFEQMDQMIEALYELRWIPQGIRASSLEIALHAIVTKVLGNPEITPAQRKTDGLTLVSISRARDLFFRWAYTQMDLDSRLASKQDAQKIVPNIQIRPYLNPNVISQLEKVYSSDWDDFLSLRQRMRPLFADGSYRVTLVRSVDLPRYHVSQDFHNLTQMNLWRTVASLLFRGYSSQAGGNINWDSGITKKELEQFYSDFRQIGVDLKLVDERNPNMGGRDFISGKLFTYSADGLSSDPDSPKFRLRMTETMELFSFLFSGALVANDMYASLLEVCKAKGPVDLYQRPMVSRACTLENLPYLFEKHLTNMPQLQQFLARSSSAVRQSYTRTLLETAASPIYSRKEWVEFSELTTLSVVTHYAEAVMTRYDQDGDGILSGDEIYQASDTFIGFIQSFAKEKMGISLNEMLARWAFYYILAYREIPTGVTDLVPGYVTIRWNDAVVKSNDSTLRWIFKHIFDKGELPPGVTERAQEMWGLKQLKLDRSDLSTVFRVIISKLFDASKKPSLAESSEATPRPSAPCQGADITLSENCGSISISP